MHFAVFAVVVERGVTTSGGLLSLVVEVVGVGVVEVVVSGVVALRSFWVMSVKNAAVEGDCCCWPKCFWKYSRVQSCLKKIKKLDHTNKFFSAI